MLIAQISILIVSATVMVMVNQVAVSPMKARTLTRSVVHAVVLSVSLHCYIKGEWIDYK